MKHLFIPLALSLVLFSCQHQTPTPVQTPTTMSQTELDLLGTWKHDSTILFVNGLPPYTDMPICSNASLTFTDQPGGYPPQIYTMKYRVYDNIGCLNTQSGWVFRNDTLYVEGLNHKILELTNHKLVLQMGDTLAIQYFSK